MLISYSIHAYLASDWGNIILFNEELLDRPEFEEKSENRRLIATMVHLAAAYKRMGRFEDALYIHYEVQVKGAHDVKANAREIAKLKKRLGIKPNLASASAPKTASR